MFDARFLSKEESYHFFVCLVRDLFKWKHKLASNALTLGGRVSSRKLCILCSHVKREKKILLDVFFCSGEYIKRDQHSDFRPPVRQIQEIAFPESMLN